MSKAKATPQENVVGLYAWHKHYHGPKKVTAENARKELERIQEKKGAICAEYIIEAAKSKNSVLHPEFEWDNNKAANTYRRQQAQMLIRCIVVNVENVEEPVRAYALVSSETTPTDTEYVDVQTIIRDEDLFADAMARLLEEVHSAKHSVDELVNIAKAAKARKKLAHIGRISKALANAEHEIVNP